MEEAERLEGEDVFKSRMSGLIKLVVQAIPSYVMRCFMLPKSTCNQIAQKMVALVLKLHKLPKEHFWKNSDEG